MNTETKAIVLTAFRGLLILAGLIPLMGCMTTEMQVMRNQLDQIESKVYKLDESITADQARTRERLSQLNERFEFMTSMVKEGEESLKPDLAAISGQIMKIGSRVDEDHESLVEVRRRVDTIEAGLGRRIDSNDQQLASIQTDMDSLQSQLNQVEAAVNGNSLELKALSDKMETLLRAISDMSGGAAGYEGDTYVVVSGDTLSGIASKTGTTTRALMELNGITNPSGLQIGQTLKIPQ